MLSWVEHEKKFITPAPGYLGLLGLRVTRKAVTVVNIALSVFSYEQNIESVVFTF